MYLGKVEVIMAKKKLRPLGDITLDMEPLIQEMVTGHEMQVGEVLALVHAYLMIHCPDAREEYDDGSHPVFYYGPQGGKQ